MTVPTIEFVGGPWDGERREVPDEELFGRLEGIEVDHRPGPSPLDRLRAGERVPAAEFDHPGQLVHAYSRSEPPAFIDGARVYRYVPPS